MNIKELKIEGFKSIREITLTEPNPFSVFVGPNAAGKSNIFEAIEFLELCNVMWFREVSKYFGGDENIFGLNNTSENPLISFNINLGEIQPSLKYYKGRNSNHTEQVAETHDRYDPLIGKFNTLEYIQFTNFSRIFVKNRDIVKQNIQDDSKLASDASNLEKVLKRIFKNEAYKEEILELLQLLIPGFGNIEIRTEELSGSDNLLIYEKNMQRPLNKRLISDGTYNIISLIAAIFQSDTPQFLCIEEPENGLNSKVVREMVNIFREKCKEKGHYIWLNTHSQTLVSELTTEEIILVDKVEGETRVKQVKGMGLHGMKMDEALLTNSLGGGIPW